MKKVLLLNPCSEQFGGVLARYMKVGIPVAVGVLAAYLKKYGFCLKVYDEETGLLDSNKLKNLLKGFDEPLIVGISILTVQAYRAYELVKMIKEAYPQSIIVVGGIHVTALPLEALQNGADFVVRGEGEVPFLELLNALFEGKDWHSIRGISYFKKDGQICNNPDAELIRELDDIPIFPYELFEHPRYDMGFITSARGCPYKCSYCSQRLVTGLTYRFHSPERVVENLGILIDKYKQKHIVFYDDNFSVKKSRVIELCNMIVATGLNKKAAFSIQTRADNMYEAIMPYMKKANFISVALGMETGIERLARIIEKDQTVATHKEAVKLIKKYGLQVSLLMIMGLPTETRADRQGSYRVVKGMKPHFAKWNNLIPYPGTVIYNRSKGSQQMYITRHWKNFNSTIVSTQSIFNPTPLPFIPEGTTEWQLRRDVTIINFKIFFSPKHLYQILTRNSGAAFVILPKYWFLRPREIFEVCFIGFTYIINVLAALLPHNWGQYLYFIFTHKKRNQICVQDEPNAIDGSMRDIYLQPKVAEAFSSH